MPAKDMAAYMADRYKRRRTWALQLLGGVCAGCGTDTDLEFHHRDPTLKSFNVGRAFAGWSTKRLTVELGKCELRCGECHKERHAAKHGTRSMYVNQRCRCDECRRAVREYWRQRRAASINSDALGF